MSVPTDHFTLHLPPALRERITAFTTTGYPNETCGLLVGRRIDQDTRVENLVQARNLNTERARDRYELAPDDFVATDRTARERGLEIVGTWHSHPDHPAVPSSTDLERAWMGWSYLIAAVEWDGLQDLRSWRLHDEHFIEEVIKKWLP
jgi:proteasome lid subunit RPN8/RPN11